MSGRRVVEPAAADVLAAGALVWRHGPDGVQTALVHRPRYDDWSLPKGKLDPGETMPFAAVREIFEETGHHTRLGPVLGDVRYPVAEGQKLVRYWAAEALHGEFAPGDETDELRWLDLSEAKQQLSYPHDVEVLRHFAEHGPPTAVLALVRHAKAGHRAQWDGDDALRPLSGSGREQAERLDRLLGLFGPDRIVSAPPVRCRETVAPLAQRLNLPVADEPLLGEDGYWDDPAAGRARLRDLAAEPGVTVACSQGGVIPDHVEKLTTGIPVAGVEPGEVEAKKGSSWLLTFGPDARLRTADYYRRPTG